MDIHPNHETTYTTKYQELFLDYVANEYYAKHRCLPVIKPERVPSINLSTSVTVAGSSQSCFDPSDLSRDDAKYIAPEYVAETTPG